MDYLVFTVKATHQSQGIFYIFFYSLSTLQPDINCQRQYTEDKKHGILPISSWKYCHFLLFHCST